MNESIISSITEKTEMVKLRWEAVKEDINCYEEWRKFFFKVFGSIGDAAVETRLFYTSGKIERTFAIIVDPCCEDINKFEYVLIHVIYNSEKVDGLFGYTNNYNEIKRFPLNMLNEVYQYLKFIEVREPDLIY